MKAVQTTQNTATATATPASEAPARAVPAVHSAEPRPQVSRATLEQSLAQELGDFDDDGPRRGSKPKGANGKGRQVAEPENDDLDAEDPELEEEAFDDESELEEEEHDDEEDEFEEEEESEAESDEDEDEEEAESEETDDEEEPPAQSKGLDVLPKWAKKRILKQVEASNALKQALASRPVLMADPLQPLAHCVREADLETALDQARASQEAFEGLGDEDFVAGKDGVERFARRVDGKTVELTRDEVAAELALAKARLDPKALIRQQKFIQQREQQQPWVEAEALAPGLLQPGTPANGLYDHIVTKCPEFKARLPQHEIIIARAVRDMLRDNEQQPRKGFPKGQFKWVRLELDKDGKIVPPKRTVAGKQPAAKAAVRSRTPTSSRPAVQAGTGGNRRPPDLDKAMKLAATKRTPENLRKVLEAEMAGLE